MRLVSLTYINSAEFDQPLDWINRLYAFTGVLEEISKEHTVFSIEQINYTGDHLHKGVHYYFRNYGTGVSRFPFRLHGLVKKLKPDVVLVRGLHFPLQLIQLRAVLGNRPIIICEHHADKVSVGWKKILNRLAGRKVNAFHFTSAGNAQEWIDTGNIKNRSKCREIPAGSTSFSGYDKKESRKKLGWDDGFHFIWTGRLDKNKDPLTVLVAFSRFLAINSSARLHLIFMADQLLCEVKMMIDNDPVLASAVVLHGSIPHGEIELWYSASDFYISASYYEGGSIALIEAMACGCIPVVSSIPSSLAAIADGKYGFYFKPGDADDLYKQLQQAVAVSIPGFSTAVRNHFRQEFSFEAIAGKFVRSWSQ